MYNKVKLDNGLKIISHSMPGRQSLALGIWIKIGGRYENDSNKGISHFLEHMLFKGTKKYSCRKIKESIEGVGGSLNGFTSEELTCYLVKIPAHRLELALDVLSSMVINPTLPAQDLEREKTVILEEIKMYRDLPQSYVHELLDGLLWPGQPLGEPVIGSVETVSRVSRADLAAFKGRHYTPDNIVVSAAGSLDHKKLVKGVTKIFAGLKAKGKNSFVKVKEEQNAPGVNIFNKDTEQTHLALGFHSLQREHPLRHALGMLHIALGANMSSRLFNELREKRGLAYEIGSQVRRFQDTGVFLVHAGIDNRKVPEAVELILRELRKAKNKLITAQEFVRAKDFYLGQLMLALEDTLDHMLWIGECTAAMDKTYTIKDIIKEVQAVKIGDLRKVAAQIFRPEKLNLAMIGPLAASEKAIREKLHF